MSNPPADATAAPPPEAADLACPLCGYSLRGLTTPRCPECGFAFAWADLIDAKRDRHPWLFEHAGRRPRGRWRDARAFAATSARTAVPRRFWRAVTPANPVHVGRLVVYWAIAAVPLLGVLAIGPVRLAVDLARTDTAQRAAYTPTVGRPGYFTGPPIPFYLPTTVVASSPFRVRASSNMPRPIPYGSLNTLPAAELDDQIPRPWSVAFFRQVRDEYAQADTVDVGRAVAIVVAWPWLSAAALLVFRASMRRAKVGVRHVLRVAVYGCDFGLLVAALAVVLYALPIGPYGVLANAIPMGPVSVRGEPVVLAVAACLVVATYRLSVGCGRYLRFDRPVLAAVASQVMVGLAVGVVLVRTTRVF